MPPALCSPAPWSPAPRIGGRGMTRGCAASAGVPSAIYGRGRAPRPGPEMSITTGMSCSIRMTWAPLLVDVDYVAGHVLFSSWFIRHRSSSSNAWGRAPRPAPAPPVSLSHRPARWSAAFACPANRGSPISSSTRSRAPPPLLVGPIQEGRQHARFHPHVTAEHDVEHVMPLNTRCSERCGRSQRATSAAGSASCQCPRR